MPSDLVLGDVYLPPLFAAAVVALLLSSLTTRIMAARGWYAWFSSGPLVFISLVVIYTVILGTFLFPT